MRACPICGEPMKQEVRAETVNIDVCPTHGMWLDKTELYQLTEKARYESPHGATWLSLFRRPVYPPVDRERIIFCPICEKQMELTPHEDVFIDWCREHGVWLDNGELEAILHNLRRDPFYLRGVALRLQEAQY